MKERLLKLEVDMNMEKQMMLEEVNVHLSKLKDDIKTSEKSIATMIADLSERHDNLVAKFKLGCNVY